jgi:hypothetical protein
MKDLVLFGNSLTVAEVTVTADQDLYLPQPYSCPAVSLTCAQNHSGDCPPCNFATHSNYLPNRNSNN